jgi:hypothetical protein
MPRKSSAALSLATYSAGFGRLQPPSTIGRLERELFIAVTASLDPQHFEPSDLPMLCAYVRACAMEQRAAETLQGNPRDSDAVAVHSTAIRAMASLSLRLRLLPQSRKPNLRGRSRQAQPSAYQVMGLMR